MFNLVGKILALPFKIIMLPFKLIGILCSSVLNGFGKVFMIVLTLIACFAIPPIGIPVAIFLFFINREFK